MVLRLAPSAIDRYLHEDAYRYYVDEEGIRWGVPVRIPSGAGTSISLRLTPILERFVDETHRLAFQLLDEENERGNPQSQYQLKNPKTRHYDEAAVRISNDPLKYIFEDRLEDIEVSNEVEQEEPNERRNSNDPHGGD